MDYKERLNELLNNMVADNNAGLIPVVIAETIHELELSGKAQNVEYWTIQKLWTAATEGLKK